MLAGFSFATAVMFLEHLADFRASMEAAARMNQAALHQHGLFEGVLRPLYYSMGELLVLVVPVLVVPVVAAERQRATWQLLLAAPLGPFRLVGGKLLAAWLLASGCLALPAVSWPLLLELFAERCYVPWDSVAWSACGLCLLALGLCAVCLFLSVLVEGVLPAAALSASVLLLLWFAGWIASGRTGPVAGMLHALSSAERLQGFLSGEICLADLAWTPCMTAAAGFAAVAVLAGRRVP